MLNLTVYLDFSPEIENLFQSQALEIESIIKEANLTINLRYGPLQFQNEKNRSKDIVPIIIASSAGLAALVLSLSRLLDSYFNRPHFFEWDELEEIRENDRLIRDASGNPVWKIKRKHVVITTEQLKDEHSMEFGAGIKGIVLKVKSAKK